MFKIPTKPSTQGPPGAPTRSSGLRTPLGTSLGLDHLCLGLARQHLPESSGCVRTHVHSSAVPNRPSPSVDERVGRMWSIHTTE